MRGKPHNEFRLSSSRMFNNHFFSAGFFHRCSLPNFRTSSDQNVGFSCCMWHFGIYSKKTLNLMKNMRFELWICLLKYAKESKVLKHREKYVYQKFEQGQQHLNILFAALVDEHGRTAGRESGIQLPHSTTALSNILNISLLISDWYRSKTLMRHHTRVNFIKTPCTRTLYRSLESLNASIFTFCWITSSLELAFKLRSMESINVTPSIELLTNTIRTKFFRLFSWNPLYHYIP